MTPDLWQEVSDCLDRLMELEPEAAGAYLRELRATRPAVCAEVESLWDQDTVSHQLDTPPAPLLSDVSALLGGGSARDRVLPADTVGEYRLLGEIARGGMGAVFEAADPVIGRTLAIKVLLPELKHHPEARARFLREARITGRLQHPGIPPVHELGEFPDGTPYFAMKLIRGRTLAEKLLAAKPDRAETVATFEQICHTLAYAHSQATIHRDLKPSNVMVGAFGEVQVMDWGLAKVLGDAEPELLFAEAAGDAGVTRSGDIRGTPAFMAPEQAIGDPDELDERCDVFGLGGILVAMLTQKPTFIGFGQAVLQLAQAGEVSDALRRVEAEGVDGELLAIVRRCLEPKKEDRYRDAGELGQAVTEYRESARRKLEEAELARQTALTQAREEQRRRRVTLAMGSALLVAVSAGLAVAIWLGLLAEQRREAAVTAEGKVSQEKDRTEETAKEARKAIKDSFILATEHPEFQKHGMQAARKLLLDRALEFYREFSQLRADDAALQAEVADARQRIGYILAERGQHQDALAEYERAIAIYHKLSARQSLVAAYRDKSREERELGKRDAATESLTAARTVLSPLLQAEPENPEYLYQDAKLLENLGHIAYELGQLDTALGHYRQSLDKVTDLYYRMKFQKVKVAECAASNLVCIGHVLKDQCKPAEALKSYQRARQPLEDIHKAQPTPHSFSELARLHGSLAIVQGHLKQTDAELQSYRTAIAYREQLVAANPIVPDYRFELVTSYFNLAGTLKAIAESKGVADVEGRKMLEKAVEVGAVLVERPADKVAYYHGVAFVRIALAKRLRREDKDYDAARKQLTEAKKLLDEIDRRKAMTPLFRETLADWEREAGMVAALRNEFDPALVHFGKAIRVLRQLADEGFRPTHQRREIARIRMSEAAVPANTGRVDEALRIQFLGVEELARLLKESPNDGDTRGSHARAVENMRQLARDALNKAFPFPKNNTIANVVKYHEERIARLQAWHRTYPTVDPFRDEVALEAVGIAGNYGLMLAPERKHTAEVRAGALVEIDKALTVARNHGLKDAKHIEQNVGLVHFRKLPEYQQFLATLK